MALSRFTKGKDGKPALEWRRVIARKQGTGSFERRSGIKQPVVGRMVRKETSILICSLYVLLHVFVCASYVYSLICFFCVLVYALCVCCCTRFVFS